MIHPHTTLKHINDAVGYGVFAKEDIPEGTITYIKDSLELTFSPDAYVLHTEEMKNVIDKYSYTDQYGNKIVSWDFAKYVNHACNPNTMSTGYGFEIAIRDIKKGEQLTDEYGIFNLEYEMPCACGDVNCRKEIKPSDFDMQYEQWDEKVKNALRKFKQINQPLYALIDAETKNELEAYFDSEQYYKSVYTLRLKNISA